MNPIFLQGPWSRGYDVAFTRQRSWVQIPVGPLNLEKNGLSRCFFIKKKISLLLFSQTYKLQLQQKERSKAVVYRCPLLSQTSMCQAESILIRQQHTSMDLYGTVPASRQALYLWDKMHHLRTAVVTSESSLSSEIPPYLSFSELKLHRH